MKSEERWKRKPRITTLLILDKTLFSFRSRCNAWEVSCQNLKNEDGVLKNLPAVYSRESQVKSFKNKAESVNA